jgi:hypothetical protein
MKEIESVVWKFFGYETAAGGRLVQEWFDGLLAEEKDEARDTLGYLQTLPLRLWSLPEYEPLGDGLSEIRFKVNSLKIIYRIYGFFWPPSPESSDGKKRHPSYSLLLGKPKKVKNDRDGVKEARRLKRLIERKEANVHAFKFS